MKTTTLKSLNFMMIALTLVLAVACNERVPPNRPIVSAVEDNTPPPPVVEPTRPTGEVFFRPQVCGCNNSTNILVPDAACTTFCQGKNTNGDDRLYVNFTISDLIAAQFGTTRNWCTADVGTVDVNSSCVIRGRTQIDDDNFQVIDEQVTDASGSTGNSFFISLENFSFDKTYIITLVARSEAGEFMSDSVQIRKVSPGSGPIDAGPLGVQPVSQYACINRFTQSTPINGGTNLIAANQLHFYFVEQLRPDPLPPGFTQGFCHNFQTFGDADNVLFPRLFETPNAFGLWRSDDTRMLNLKDESNTPAGSGWTSNIDAEDLILQKLRALGVTPTTSRFFGKLQISAGPTISSAGNSANATAPLGFYMRIFINQTNNNLAVCPKEADYASANKLFQAIGEVVQADTEAIYLARREVVTYPDPDSTTTPPAVKCVDDDFLLVRESDLRKVWFYQSGGNNLRPAQTTAGELTIRSNTMRFYYPFNFATPTVKQASQKTYTIVTPAQAGVPNAICGATSSNGGLPTTPDSPAPTTGPDSVPPHDKRFGCIPVSDSN